MGEGGSPRSFLLGDRDPSCVQVTEAGSAVPGGEGFSLLWVLEGADRAGGGAF